jgi:Flp pilus assembly pilin Flp
MRLRDESGQAAPEYALLIAFVVAFVVAAMILFEDQIVQVVLDIRTYISDNSIVD